MVKKLKEKKKETKIMQDKEGESTNIKNSRRLTKFAGFVGLYYL